MTYAYQRYYRGMVEAVICDWAGTTYDFGSMAPIRAFQELFAGEGVPITLPEAREPMGTEKREHITRVLNMPRVAQAWQEKHGKPADDQDIDRLYAAFLPMQIAAIKANAQPVPGLMDTVSWLAQHDIQIGANSGYNREMLDTLAEIAAEHGFRPVSNVSATDVKRGRPYPHMSLKNALEIGISDVRACIKVDDTIPGIEEGLAAGMWTVGVAISGNEAGLSLQEWSALNEEEQSQVRSRANRRFRHGGAHIIIDSIADLPHAVVQVEQWLAQGYGPETPGLAGVTILPGEALPQ
ncbi:phosphonoacetaldehyde hydrolase [Hahella sp. CCB-MM4]|uniref:phosphonoacetaldehyde hydrolase n=1 Tax=Hahella sp. (strain CCB-MM4) TaxID=1926491 RepID=UPI000B9BE27B|nr:phosphonoacetaldehyde hydrolase [Hahella sp. CCB-MM4]OZG70955.1 phosphonoacetaldehyde hydrolase [Hahella sp. CCB-MM4]